MTINKKQFKILVKECLLEILSENFINEAVTRSVTHSIKQQLSEVNEVNKVNEANDVPKKKVIKEQDQFDIGQRMHQFNQTLSGIHQQKQQKSIINETAAAVAQSIGAKPDIMSRIFEDTAKTTVVHQAQAVDPEAGRFTDDTPSAKINANKDWAKMAGLE